MNRSLTDPGLFDGAAALWYGFSFLQRRRDLRQLAVVPALLTLVLAVAGVVGGAIAGFRYTQGFVGHPGDWLTLILAALGALVAGAIGGLVGMSLAVPLSGPALERLARAVLDEHGVTPPQASVSILGSLGATLLGLFVSLGVVGMLAVLGMAIPVLLPVLLPMKLCVLALLLVWDVGDYAFACQGLGLGQRVAWLRRHLFAALGFGGLGVVLNCAPFLGVLLLPCGAAGMARILAATERRPGSAPIS